MDWLEGDLENFIETVAFMAGSWDLCDDGKFCQHCKDCWYAEFSPEKTASNWLTRFN